MGGGNCLVMGYWITRFGASTTLPTAAADQMIGPGPIRSSLVRLPGGGVYDTRGTDNATQAGQIISVSGIVSGTSAANLKTNYDKLRALKGDRDKLYRTPDGDGDNSEWMYARCVDVPTRRIADNKLWVPVTLSFELHEPYWHGAANSDDGTLATTPDTFEINNAGNAVATQIVLTVIATDAAIDTIVIQGGEPGHLSKITYTGEIEANGSLVLDCGAKSVEHQGTEEFDNFAIVTADHKIDEWLRLMPGNNTIYVTRTGGGVNNTITFDFDDAWE